MKLGVRYLIAVLICPVPASSQSSFRVFPYLQHPAPDAISVLWFSETDAPGQLTFWSADIGSSHTVYSLPQPADALFYSLWEDTTFMNGEAPDAPFRHRVRLQHLIPSSSYQYLVVLESDTFRSRFKTAPARDSAIRLIVYADSETQPGSTGDYVNWPDPVSGDSRSYLVDQTTGYRNNLSVIRSRSPDLVLIAGDLVQSGGEQRHWDEFWKHNTDPDQDLSLASATPILPAPGNHEYSEGPFLGGYTQPGSEAAMAKYLTYFDLPANDAPVTDHAERYYSLDYGPVTLIVLDACNNAPNGSEADTNFQLLGTGDEGGGFAPDFRIGSAQYNWLEQKLIEAQASSMFTFVICHYSPYSSGVHGFPPGVGEGRDWLSGIPLRQLTPLFMAHGVDAVFSGHDEMYERSEIEGIEWIGVEGERPHTIHFYDIGIGGDGLRGPAEGLENMYGKFLAHTDAPEIWDNGILTGGGKHYGHLEIDVRPVSGGWEADLTPVYILPVKPADDSLYNDFERREYDDRIILTAREETGKGLVRSVFPEAADIQVIPNPFSECVEITCTAGGSGNVTFWIFDRFGRTVRILDGAPAGNGRKIAYWDGRNGSGARVSPGLYHCLVRKDLRTVHSKGMICLLW